MRPPFKLFPSKTLRDTILADYAKMRCAGCGGKVNLIIERDSQGMSVMDVQIGRNILSHVLAAIQEPDAASASDVVSYDDAAIMEFAEKGYLLLQSTDFLRSFITDPYLFGQITALHCLSVVQQKPPSILNE